MITRGRDRQAAKPPSRMGRRFAPGDERAPSVSSLRANGTTCSAGVASNELSGAPAVASCVVSNFRGQAFPAPKGGCVDVNIPINFVPRQ